MIPDCQKAEMLVQHKSRILIKACIYINRYKDASTKDNFYFDKETKSIFRLVTAKTTLKTGKKEQSNVFVIEINTYFFSVILHS